MSRPPEPSGGAVGAARGTPTWSDLTAEAVADALADRAVRAYPALLSTEADAMAWARGDAPDGAVVVADYQASPRGRGGLPWETEPGRDLGFSLILRPDLAPEREGWLYTVATCGVADALETGAGGVGIAWPDEVLVDDARAAGIGVHVEHDAAGIASAVVTVLIEGVSPPRTGLLAHAVAAIERRLTQESDQVLADHTRRCHTLGRQVLARLVPLGPAGTTIEGEAVGSRADGSLAIETGPGRRIAVPPRDLGRLEEP